MLYRGDGPEYGESVDSTLDVGSGAKFICQHFGHSRNLVLGWDDQRDHTGAITKKREGHYCYYTVIT